MRRWSAPKRRAAKRAVANGAAPKLLVLLVLAAHIPAAQAEGVPFGEGLPPAVMEAMAAAADRAERHPSLLQAAIGVAPPGSPLSGEASAAGLEPLDWEVEASARRTWQGSWSGDAALSLSWTLIDPSAARASADAWRSRSHLALERSLVRRDAAMDVLSTAAALWSAHQRIRLIERAGVLEAGTPSDAVRLERLVAELPALRLEAQLLQDRLDHLASSDVHAPWVRTVWTDYLAAEIPSGCPLLAPAVRIARAEAEAQAASMAADLEAASSPSLSVRATVGTHYRDDPVAPFDTRVSVGLVLGAPASWPATGSASVRADQHDASVRIRIGRGGPGSWNQEDHERAVLSHAASSLAVARALRTAEERAALDRLALQRADVELARGVPEIASFADLDAALAWIAWTVRAVEARAHLSIDCAGPFAPDAGPVPPAR